MRRPAISLNFSAKSPARELRHRSELSEGGGVKTSNQNSAAPTGALSALDIRSVSGRRRGARRSREESLEEAEIEDDAGNAARDSFAAERARRV